MAEQDNDFYKSVLGFVAEDLETQAAARVEQESVVEEFPELKGRERLERQQILDLALAVHQTLDTAFQAVREIYHQAGFTLPINEDYLRAQGILKLAPEPQPEPEIDLLTLRRYQQYILVVEGQDSSGDGLVKLERDQTVKEVKQNLFLAALSLNRGILWRPREYLDPFVYYRVLNFKLPVGVPEGVMLDLWHNLGDDTRFTHLSEEQLGMAVRDLGIPARVWHPLQYSITRENQESAFRKIIVGDLINRDATTIREYPRMSDMAMTQLLGGLARRGVYPQIDPRSI